MKLEERMVFCGICTNRKVDFNTGLVCGLTSQKPKFENKCNFFSKDKKEAERKLKMKLDAAGTAKSQYGSLNPQKNINYGAFLVVSGVLVLFLLSILFGGIILTTGISFLIRGYSQNKILKENKSFNEKLRKQ